MSEDTLKLAQTLLDVTKRAHDRSASFIGTCGEVQDVAAALIDIHERMGKIVEEADPFPVNSPATGAMARILALTKGKT